jgi:putative peptidoglycan lipid II flippase
MIVTVLMMGDTANGLALAIGASLGGVLSFIYQIPAMLQVRSTVNGHRSTAIDDISPFTVHHSPLTHMHAEYNHILVPALFSTGLSQILVFIDGFYCKGLPEGSFTSLTLANRLIQLPLGVLLTAFLVPLFPRITKLVKGNDLNEIKRLLIKAIRMLILLCIPAIVVGMIWPHEIIRLLFERGAFDARSTAMVADLFFYLCLSIIPYVLRDSFARACYSFGDARSPLIVMIISIAMKFTLNSYFVEHYGLNGIAISTTIISVVNAIILFVILNNKFKKLNPEKPTV